MADGSRATDVDVAVSWTSAHDGSPPPRLNHAFASSPPLKVYGPKDAVYSVFSR